MVSSVREHLTQATKYIAYLLDHPLEPTSYNHLVDTHHRLTLVASYFDTVPSKHIQIGSLSVPYTTEDVIL
jgi:hypothetical protein